jgi:hypothetical protein
MKANEKKENMKIDTKPLTSKFDEVSALEAKLAALKQEADTERRTALKELPAQFGFTDAASFVKAFRQATGVSAIANTVRKPRASITEEKKNQIVVELTKGIAAMDIANKYSVSLASVQNIKKGAGLVRARAA